MKRLLLFTLVLFGVYVNAQEISQSDKDALIALYNATDGANWTNKWDLNDSPQNWYGVTIDDLGNVVEIDLYRNNLNGIIPVEIGKLTNLKKLFLNGVKGTIPVEITNLVNLESLLLLGWSMRTISEGMEGLTGTIPVEIGSLTKLKYLNLSWNQLTGAIPSQIGSLNNLTILNLRQNQLTGTIPSVIGNLTKLNDLDLSQNQLTGTISPVIGNLTSLKYLTLSGNQFTGEIPIEIFSLSDLEKLVLGDNQLTGVIPSQIGDLTKLKELFLSRNKFTGGIPIEIGKLVNLETLYLVKSQLTGTLPSEIGSLTKLKRINLDYNQLSGEIPVEIGSLTNLSNLSLESNQLSGEIPSEVGRLINLESFRIGNNRFVFEDLEKEHWLLKSKLAYYTYSPQTVVGLAEEHTLVENESISLIVNETYSANNTYQWRKDGVEINGATSREYVINDVALTDEGSYDCVINNTIITDLTLYKNVIKLNVGPKDSDNDGVNNDKDLCPNTPAGESVNADGCSESQLDDDKDGVNNDKDLCSNTPTGESVNANGCSESQLDNDNDGIFNNVDKCPNTNEGSVVDANGCAQYQLIDIAPSDIQIMVSSTTCPDKSNGVVNISFNKDYTYKVILVGQGVINKTFDNVNYTSGLEITGLSVGSYEICVTASELPSFSQCYNVLVSAPAALKVSQTSLKGTSLTYQVSGSENYKVTVNNKEYLYTFKDAGEREITVNLNNGNNSVEITTNKPCQGVYNKSVTVKSITLYPIPVTNYLNISGVTGNSAIVTVRSLEGATVLSAKLDVYNGGARLPMDTLATGMYLVTVTTSTQTVNTKIFKK